MTTHEPIPRLSHHQVGQSVILKGITDALIVSAIRPDGYYDLSRYGKLLHTAAGSHEVEHGRT